MFGYFPSNDAWRLTTPTLFDEVGTTSELEIPDFAAAAE